MVNKTSQSIHLDKLLQPLRSSKSVVTLPQSTLKAISDIVIALKGTKNMRVLFTGLPGTGKTCTATLLAKETQLDIYRIDLSGVVSKYIGQTEKNLKSIFDAAERSDVILFFDEADALFGRRSGIKDSHDRFTNNLTNYLLARLETYKGLIILSTNKKEDLDTRLLSHIRFIIDIQAQRKKRKAKKRVNDAR